MGMKNLAFVLAMVSPIASPVFAAQLMPLAAHRAVYDLKLLQGTSNKAPSDARGRIAFDFTGSACDGYVMNFRQITEMTPAEGAVRVSDMKSATFEDGEGKAFRFTVQTKLDGGADDDLDGQALRASNGDLSIELKRPKLKKADMGQNVIFPTDHIKRILATARDGGTTLGVKVFDGSDGGEKIFDTLSVIGKPLTSEPQEAAAHKPELAGMRCDPKVELQFSKILNGGKLKQSTAADKSIINIKLNIKVVIIDIITGTQRRQIPP